MSSSSGRGNFPLTYVISVTGAEAAASKFGQVKSGLEGTNQAATPLNKNLATTDKGLTQTGKSASGLGEKLKTTTKPIGDATKNTKGLGTQVGGMSKKMDEGASKFQKNKGMIFGLTMLSSGIIEAIGMFSMYSDAAGKVTTAQDELNKITAGGVTATESYQKALEKRNEAQTKVNDLVNAGKTNTPQYTKAVRALKEAEAELNTITEGGIKGTKEYQDASDNLAESQKGLRFVQRNMILSMTDLIPMSLLVVSGLVGMKTAALEAAAAQAAAGGATTKLAAGMKLLRVAMMAVPIVAIGAALLAIRNNTFGFRDSLDALGVSIGKTFPQLKGFLTWVKDLGTALGLTGGKLDFSRAWDIFVNGFLTAWHKITTFDYGKALSTIVQKIEDFLNDPNNMANLWKGFHDALYSTGKWIDANMPKIVSAITKFIDQNKAVWWKSFQDALWSSGQWIKTQLAQVGKAILQYIKTNSPTWWVEFQNALWSTGQWIKTQLAQIGKAILNYIKTSAAGWWLGFQNALGASVTWVTTQMKKIATAIVNYDWAKTGTDIWNKIAGGIQGAFNATGDFFGKLFNGKLLQEGFADEAGGKGVTLDQANKMMDAGFGGLSSHLTQQT